MHAKSLLALAATLAALAIGSAESGRVSPKLTEFCRDIGKKISPRSNSKATYEAAMKQSSAWFSIGSVRSLAAAWKAVTFDEQCSSKSLTHFKYLEECNPGAVEALKNTLDKDAHSYATKCFTPAYMDEQLNSATSGLFAHRTSKLPEFLNDEFLANYRKSNPDEVDVHIGNYLITGTCCEPHRSKKAMLKALEPVFKTKGEGKSESLEASGDELAGHLDARLFKPCKSYVSALSSLMDKAYGAGRFFKGGERYFFEDLSPQFKDAVFRYKFCKNLSDRKDREDLMNLLRKVSLY